MHRMVIRMLELAVCDDSVLFLEEMKETLETDSRVKKITVYENPEELLRDIEEGKKIFDAIFMDIEFGKEENGIQYVRKIFQKAPQIQLIYVTGYQDKYIQNIFLTEANLTGYLMKPLDRELLSQYLDKICEKREPKKIIRFSVRGKQYLVAADNVLYLESNNHRVIIHTENNSYSVYDKLSNFHAQLPASFIQCHKSFLVNMNQIRHIVGNEVYFQDGNCVPVSKVHQERVRKSYFAYIGKTI